VKVKKKLPAGVALDLNGINQTIATINAGRIVLGHAQALQFSALNTASAGKVTATGFATPTLGGLTGSTDLATVIDTGYSAITTLTLNPQTGQSQSYSGVIADGATGMNLVKSGAGTQTLTNAQTYTGSTNIDGGTLQLDGSTHASSTVNIGTAGALTGTGTVNGNATLTGNGIINKASGTIAGTLAVTGGNWNGAGTVSGAVTQTSGVFSIGTGANLTATSGLDVTGGTLTGAGAITGNTSIGSGAIHNAGGIGTVGSQAITGNLDYGTSSIFDWDLNANSTASGFDTVSATGDITVGASTVFNVVFGTGVDLGDVFWSTASPTQEWSMASIFGKVFTSGSFASVTSTADPLTQGAFTITGGGSTLTWTAVPEPTSALAGLLLGAGLLRRRRK
jgi:autotransporter-associated beta strand protein